MLIALIGCGTKEEKKSSVAVETEKHAVDQTVPPQDTSAVPPTGVPLTASDIVVVVDGSKMTREQVASEIRKKMAAMKGQIPKERLEQVRTEMRKQIINDFIVRTLLTNEIQRLKFAATDQEVSEAVERVKSSLPQGMTIEDLLKKNNITKEKMYDEIRLGIKVNKLVLSQKGSKVKPTDKEISKFYQKNIDKFTVPESVRVRHILIAKAEGDDEKTKTEKRDRAEKLRGQLLAGANFEEVAKNHSDCPSKNSGGDLGVFARGEMVKPFDDAAFSQEKHAIGPVVETNFGYHIIQVLDHLAKRTMSLDETTKDKISAYLQQQKQQEVFETLVKTLRAKSNVVVYQ